MTESASKATSSLVIDCAGVYYRDLNARLREAVDSGVDKIELRNVQGQRYIGTDLDRPVHIDIYGTPGNDLAAFMDGPRIEVHGNAQDGTGNTMNNGEIVIHGHAGDLLGLSARGGRIFVHYGVGYRAGIHMKEYKEKKPVLVIGGSAQDFLGEYMAGGVLVVLGLDLKEGEPHRSNFLATGMHGGVIYLRGNVESHQLGKEVGVAELTDSDRTVLNQLVGEYCQYFGHDAQQVLSGKFVKLFPRYLRPYGRLYTP